MERGMKTRQETFMLKAWAWLALHPVIYALATKIGVRFMRLWGGKEKLIHSLPGASGWTDGRDFPAPRGQTFRELYKRGNRK
jgi:L-lactate dehydrogenase complex protein LldF